MALLVGSQVSDHYSWLAAVVVAGDAESQRAAAAAAATSGQEAPRRQMAGRGRPESLVAFWAANPQVLEGKRLPRLFNGAGARVHQTPQTLQQGPVVLGCWAAEVVALEALELARSRGAVVESMHSIGQPQQEGLSALE